MPISIEKRIRIIFLYEKNGLHLVKGRYTKLKMLAASEDIHMKELGLRKLVEKWQKFGT